MTLTIELTPETERRVRRLPDAPVSSEYEVTEALFQQWAKEDTTLTPEEAEREDEDWRQIEAHLQRH